MSSVAKLLNLSRLLSRFAAGRCIAVCVGFVIALAQSTLSLSAQPEHSVLVLFSNESLLPANQAILLGLQEGFRRKGDLDLQIYDEYLDAVRFADPARVVRLPAEVLRILTFVAGFGAPAPLSPMPSPPL